MEKVFNNAGLVCLAISAVLAAIQISTGRVKKQVSDGDETSFRKTSALQIISLTALIAGFLAVSASIAFRMLSTGHGPFSGMYEFSMAFSWGILLMSLFFWWRYRIAVINILAVAIAFALVLLTNNIQPGSPSLVPALQNSFLLSAHVSSAVIAYGAFTIGFVAAILYLLQRKEKRGRLPASQQLEDISYHSVLIGFPFMTLVIVLGALWADIAWGRYWGWDPKETASLATWLIYAGYLHSRIVRGWRGKKTALLLVLGFGAVIFTFLGNYIFSGLHSYF